MPRSQIYSPLPEGIDRYWQTPVELYFYLLHTPHERQRIQGDINRLWSHRKKAVRIIHQCSAEIKLPPNTGDLAFVRQLSNLLEDEGIYHQPKGMRWRQMKEKRQLQQGVPGVYHMFSSS